MESGIRRKGVPGLSAKNVLHHGVDYTTFEGIESQKRAKMHQTTLRGSMVWDADNGGVDGEKGKTRRGGVLTGKDVRINGYRRMEVLEGIDTC
jgi:hypothetical protein